MSILTINNAAIQTYFIPQPLYHLSTNFSCTDNGWWNGSTGGTATCEGGANIAISNLLGRSSGFVRFQLINNSNEVGLTKENGTPLNIGEVIPVSQVISATLFAQCSGTYPCTPTIVKGTYTLQYSQDGINNWYNFNLDVI